MAIETRDPINRWSILGFCCLAAIVCLFTFVDPVAGMRGLGVATIGSALGGIVSRRIPYGWEGREPSGHITGGLAVALSLLLGGLGLAMLVRPRLMLILFGWSEQ